MSIVSKWQNVQKGAAKSPVQTPPTFYWLTLWVLLSFLSLSLSFLWNAWTPKPRKGCSKRHHHYRCWLLGTTTHSVRAYFMGGQCRLPDLRVSEACQIAGVCVCVWAGGKWKWTQSDAISVLQFLTVIEQTQAHTSTHTHTRTKHKVQ